MLDSQKLLAFRVPQREQVVTRRDTILYALGLGFGERPTDPRHLEFVFEKGLKAVPTMANVLAHPGFWAADPGTTIDPGKMLHGEQRVKLHAPLPVEGTIVGRTEVIEIIDKGAGQDAHVISRRTLSEKDSGQLLAEIDQLYVCRGQGGGGSVAAPGASETRAQAAPRGDGPADLRFEIAISPQAALIYRLSGDMNPLHADPSVAEKAGFSRPILHGLASFGFALRGLLEADPALDVDRISGLAVRFSAPVYPGDRMVSNFWKVADGYAFDSSVVGRERPVLSRGHVQLAPAG